MSMAAGEYVWVSSQANTEAVDLARETAEFASAPEAASAELAGIYRARGIDPETANLVARQLMAGPISSAPRRALHLGARWRWD